MPINRLETDRLEGLWTDASDTQSPEESAEAKLSAWVEQIERYLATHPRTLLIAAVAVGVTLGWLGKRK